MEIEKKFLVKSIPDNLDSYKLRIIEQGYLCTVPAIRVRKDNDLNLNLSKVGFDTEMMSYPYVILINGKKYMFYNGNQFGKEGIGLAIEE